MRTVMRLLVVAAFAMFVGAKQPFTLRSPAFSNGGSIPEKFTCAGADVSPPLSWRGAPEETKAFALVCEDPDAPGGLWVHWVIYNLPPGRQSAWLGQSRLEIRSNIRAGDLATVTRM